MRPLTAALHLLPIGLTLACALWVLTQSPFTAPMVQRTTAQIEAALTRAMAREVTLAWLLPRVQEALLTEDLMQLDLLLGLANDHGVMLPLDMVTDIQALVDARSGLFARGAACGACAVDVTACDTLAQIGACAVPFEMTPAGDLNALRRASVAYVGGEEVDRLDLGLALVGLTATGAVAVSGGGSLTIKAGTTVMRIARRLGTLSAPFAARLSGLVGDAVRWDRMGDLAARRIAPAEVLNAAKLDELRDIGRSLARVADGTSVPDAVLLLRHVDTAEDAARLARVTDALGPRTRGAFDVLGKSRVFRATVRLSDLAIGAVVALWALGVQVLVFLGQQIGNMVLRGVRRGVAARGRGRAT